MESGCVIVRYINPGYAEFLDADGTTVTGTTYNPTNGVALYQPTDNEGINISLTATHFYAKFDVYIAPIADLPSNTFAKVGILKPGSINAGFCGLLLYKYSSSYIHMRSMVGNANDKTVTNSDVKVNFGGINSFYLHYKARSESTADGEYQIYMNGDKISSGTGKWVFLDNTTKLVIYSVTDKCLISNIIMSDEEIGMRERITAVPLTNLVTDMIDRGDGTYLADTAGQQILSTADVVSLVSAYGAASKVTGIAIAGNPAYRTGEELATLTGISKADGGSQIEHGAKTLKTSETAGAIDCYAVDTTIADMAGMQLGWKVGV